ncbi:hypothetical protein [Roseomonas rosulenta]|uniref:hypothetical protein n=1 Tax=Roseomonas rosulenta TaxID=2748667 RepID=UPI0018DF1131|nr:hypothetical protein [Roseomonas rosulenta]
MNLAPPGHAACPVELGLPHARPRLWPSCTNTDDATLTDIASFHTDEMTTPSNQGIEHQPIIPSA